MTKIEATYRLRVHERGVTEPSDATVDFTLGASALADLPTIPGPVARPLDGRTETQAWTLGVVDTGDVLTSRLASGGRMHLLGRLAEYQESRDGGSTWETLYTGRIAGVTETSLGRYDVRLADERWHERQARIFTATDTTSIWPIGTLHEWRLGATLLSRWYWPVFDAAGVDPFGRVAVRIQRIPEHCPLGGRITQAAINLIRSDRIERDSPDLTTANYKTLRLHIETPDGAEAGDAEVIGFDTDFRTYLGLTTASPAASLDESLETGEIPERVWVRWPDGMTPPGPLNRSFVGYLYAPDHEPTHALPLHLGVYESGHPWGGASSSGVHPFEIVRRIYDAAGVRYDPDAFDALAQDPTYYSGTWRITEPARVAEWVERHIYQPTLVLPFIDNQGRVSPKSLIPPANLDPDDLFVFDASNTKPPYPTFDHQDGEVANVVVPTLDADAVVRSDDPADHDALDGWTTESRELDPIRHDTVEADPPLAPEKPVRIDVSGWQMWDILRAQVYARFAAHVLQRFGDGPVAHVLYGTEATREVQAGDFVIIDQDSLRGPNPATNARSGKRLVQILKRDILPIGYRYEILDLGPALQPLSAPSVSVAQDSGNQKHSILVTLSNVPAGATANVEVAYDSDFERVVHVVTGLGNGTHAIGPLASGAQFYVRAESMAPGRIRSASSATQTVTTQALSAPTNAAATASGRTIRLDWTPTEPGYAIMPTLDGEDALPAPLPAGSTTYVFTGLEPSTQYTVGVKHVDPYGGASAIASDTETTGASTQLAAPRRLWIRQGRTDPAQPGGGFLGELVSLMRTGLEVQFVPGEPQASHRLQAATDAAFNEIIIEVPIRPGVDRVRFPTALRADLVYVRIRSERDGYTESDWSEVVSAYPTVLQDETPDSDMLPGGWATARIDEAGKVWLDIGSDDPDTDRAYYTVNTTAYTEPSTGSTHVDRSAMPTAIDTGVTLQYGQTAYIWVRFWKGGVFGQATRLAVTRTADALAPSIQADPVQSSSTGTLTLTINDPGRRVQEVQYQIRQGGGSFGGTWLNTWDSSTGTPGSDATLERTKSVTLVKGHNSEIKWRIAWTDAAGNVRVHIDSHAFDSDTTADVQGVQVNFNDAGQVVVSAIGDEDTTAMYVTAAVGSDPADPTASSASISGRHGTVTLTSVTVAPGQTAHVKVRGRNAAGQLGPVRLVRVPKSTVLYTECRAWIVNSNATTVTIQVDATPAHAEVHLLGTVKATRLSGPSPGVPAPSGTQWVFERPAFQQGEGQAVFRAEAPGYESDDDTVVISEVGRDTVGLVMRASVQQVTATQITVRVAVADPFPGSAITIAYSATGGTGLAVTPGSPQTIPAGSVTSDLATTGYVDFTITRPAAGSGGGRVTFTATRSGRVADVDAVDVPELPPNVPVQALPPVARIEYLQDDGTFYQLRLTGQLGAGAAGSLEYRRRTVIGGVPGSWGPGAGDGWASLPGGGATYTAARQPRDEVVVELEVRDADGRVGTDRYTIGPGLPGIGSGGRALWSEVEDDDGGRAQTIDGATRARTGLTAGGRLRTGVEPTADIAGRPAADVRAQAESPTQNLLSPGAGPEKHATTDTIRYVGTASDASGAELLEAYGLRPGDVISLGAEGRLGPGANWARIRIRFFDSGGNVLATADTSPMVEGTTYTLTRVEGVEIPAGAVSWVVYGNYSGARDFYFRRAMLNRGPVALSFTEPPGRPGRERIDVWDGSLRPTVTASDGASAKLLPKGILHGLCWNGLSVVYEQSYQNAPIPIVYQGTTIDERSGVWYDNIQDALNGAPGGGTRITGGRVKQVWAVIASKSGFTPRLVLMNLGANPTPESVSFSATPLSVGQASASVTPSSNGTPSVGDKYTIDFAVTVIRGTSVGNVEAYITVVPEISLNGGAYAEYPGTILTVTIPDGQNGANASGSFQFVAPIDGNDSVRLRFKALAFSEPTPLGAATVTPGDLTWFKPAATQYCNATPDGEADAMPFVIIPQG